ncbi:MAG: ABC transporter permease [Bacilli bacterium]|nr:ABC transporter permease [Bacilli bacterium]
MNKYFKKLAIPYFVWLYILAIIPFMFMVILSFVSNEGLDFSAAIFTLENFGHLTASSTVIAFMNSFFYAVIATIVCIVIGYMVAYAIFRSHFKNKFLVMTILILPMWSNMLLRIEALKNLMEPHNIITDLLAKIGINLSLNIAGTPLAVIIGLISTYIPFMILSIYTALEKIDYSLEEAALDLGLTETKKFWKVIFPLSIKGIVSGSIMVFLPCMSGFAIPEILGQGNILLIGNVIDQHFRNMNYNLGSLLAVVILVVILAAILLVSKFDKEGETLI